MSTVFRTRRSFPRSPDQVFAAIADGDRLARWWGPDGFRNSFHRFEFRPGGAWHLTMHGPDGSHYPNESRFDAIEPGKRVEIRHLSAPVFTLTIELAAAGEGTELAWAQAFDDPAVAAAVEAIVVPANEQNLDRLERELGCRA